MTDAETDPLAPLRMLVERVDDPTVREAVREVIALVERDTSVVSEQTLIATDIAARTKAGDWFQNTELTQIGNDAGHILREYKAQRAALSELGAALFEDTDAGD